VREGEKGRENFSQCCKRIFLLEWPFFDFSGSTKNENFEKRVLVELQWRHDALDEEGVSQFPLPVQKRDDVAPIRTWLSVFFKCEISYSRIVFSSVSLLLRTRREREREKERWWVGHQQEKKKGKKKINVWTFFLFFLFVFLLDSKTLRTDRNTNRPGVISSHNSRVDEPQN
jgi:hypothetical protein